MEYTIDHIAQIIQANATIINNQTIDSVVLDSRKVFSAPTSLFFALVGDRRDGHAFIEELYERGVRNFVIQKPIHAGKYRGANFLHVTNTLSALQALASYHRSQFAIPVIAITGSNGKTIVKEWLYQLLHQDYTIVRSPKSYNSQIGVPLSILQLDKTHTLGIFEAGISTTGEMEKLEKIIQPTIGVFTGIGEAHSEGFESISQKEAEKRKLFIHSKQPVSIELLEVKNGRDSSILIAKNPTGRGAVMSIEIPFTDDASVQNAITCWEVLLLFKIDEATIQSRMLQLTPVDMRLVMKKGINQCQLINDSYSADLSSLKIALDFLAQRGADSKKTVILSDFLQSSIADDELYSQIVKELVKHNVNRLIGIGERITHFFAQLRNNEDLLLDIELFPTTSFFLEQFKSTQFKDEIILIKGARLFQFEKIVQQLELKVHQTVLEINLNAIVHNLKQYQQRLRPETKTMAMVKAFAYGSGAAEIAGILQYQKVDYLGVAYADEGVELRRAGIALPIMVMNPEENAFEAIVENNLEPELYSFGILNAFGNFLQKQGIQQYPVHLEVETGMNRLGFNVEEIGQLIEILAQSTMFHVQSVFSHLAASEESEQDSFTLNQFEKFQFAVKKLQDSLGYPFIQHIANSAAAIRHPELQLDMVRLGIGLYGIDSAITSKLELQNVTTFKSTVAQIKKIKKGESVSYNRNAIVDTDSVIATIRVGYADGYSRRFGNGVGKVRIKGRLVPVIGTVCMDMFMVDITGIDDILEGDEVIIFGKELSVQQLSQWANTIPYEILTGISQRVKRVYYEE